MRWVIVTAECGTRASPRLHTQCSHTQTHAHTMFTHAIHIHTCAHTQEIAEARAILERQQAKAKAAYKEQQAKPKPGKLVKSVMGDRGAGGGGVGGCCVCLCACGWVGGGCCVRLSVCVRGGVGVWGDC